MNKTIAVEETPLPTLMVRNRPQSLVRTAAVGARPKRESSIIGGGRQSELSTLCDNDYANIPTYDILFLKRLLYLKASID